jgi:hypothetical protein
MFLLDFFSQYCDQYVFGYPPILNVVFNWYQFLFSWDQMPMPLLLRIDKTTYLQQVSIIDGGNWSTQRTSPTCHKSLTNFIT